MNNAIGDWKRFNTAKRPNRQMTVLKPVTWVVSFPKTLYHSSKIDKSGMPKRPALKPPYLLLCNHNSFMDFTVMTRAIFPHRANYVVAIDGFIGIEWLLRAVGGIGNRKFTRNPSLVKNMITARKQRSIVALFPEARYSLCGTSAPLPRSLAKLVRVMKVPVVVLLMHGHHVNSPFWNTGNRGVRPVKAEMTQIITAEETQTLSLEEIMARLRRAFVYDDFAWQKENNVRIKKKYRAQGLHKLLYQCPACNTEFRMGSEGSRLFCTHCGKSWEMTELGELKAETGETEFSHIPDWYEWERGNVQREVRSGAYSFAADVEIETLPNAKKFRKLGKGRLIHNSGGFILTGEHDGKPFELTWPISALYSCHIEYDYKGKGQCVDLSNADDTFYIYPQGTDFAVTKISLATEELYRQETGNEG
jgi:1-acyl-sn-glycerol-3-phosphate acyltransferase